MLEALFDKYIGARRSCADRLVFVDTETTGIGYKTERVLEVACIEVIDRKTTGRQIHQYINPEKEVGEGTFKVQGIIWESVKRVQSIITKE